MLKMKWYIDILENLEAPIWTEIAIDHILTSLHESYDQFVMNFNMHGIEKSLAKLHGMLKNTKQNIKKTNLVLMVWNGKGGNRKGKAKPKSKDKV